MEEFVEIGAHVAKGIGDAVYEKIYRLDGVEYIFLESGRSKDLFSDRQFGEYVKPLCCPSSSNQRIRMMFLVIYTNFWALMGQASVSCLKRSL